MLTFQRAKRERESSFNRKKGRPQKPLLKGEQFSHRSTSFNHHKYMKYQLRTCFDKYDTHNFARYSPLSALLAYAARQ